MLRRRHLAWAVVLAGTLTGQRASAQSIIKHPGEHPRYSFEAEPHLAVVPFHDGAIGPGFRGTFVVVDNGFVRSINNSVGVGIGLDWAFYGHDATDVMVPVVMQWNFWLHPHWSVFGEPGILFHFRHHKDHDFAFDPFTIFAGGRYHFNDSVALTLRLGAPVIHDNVIS